MVDSYKEVVNSDEPVKLDSLAAYKLESVGLVELQGNEAKPACSLYHIYFRDRL